MKTNREIILMLLDCVEWPETDEEVDRELEEAGVDVPAFLAKVHAKVRERTQN